MTEQTGACPSRTRFLLLWAAGLALAPLIILSDLRQLDGLRLTQAHVMIGRDFVNLWTGGRLVLGGNADVIYDYQHYLDWQAHQFGLLDPHNYSYPPPSLFLAVPVSVLGYLPALLLWSVAGIAFFLWAARPYVRGNLPLWCAVLTPAAVVNIWWGHYGFVIGGLWLIFFSAIDRQPIRAGIAAGLLTLKPHLGLLIAATMAYGRMVLAIVVALAVTAMLVIASGAVFGFGLWRQWIVDTSALQTAIMTAPGPKFYYLMMPSTFIMLRDFPVSVAIAGQVCVGLCALLLVWKARAAPSRDLAFIAASATGLISPYMFSYDLTVASLGFAMLLFGRWDELKIWERVALWTAFAAPLLVMAYGWIAPAALLAGLFIQVRHRSRNDRDTEPHLYRAR